MLMGLCEGLRRGGHASATAWGFRVVAVVSWFLVRGRCSDSGRVDWDEVVWLYKDAVVTSCFSFFAQETGYLNTYQQPKQELLARQTYIEIVYDHHYKAQHQLHQQLQFQQRHHHVQPTRLHPQRLFPRSVRAQRQPSAFSQRGLHQTPKQRQQGPRNVHAMRTAQQLLALQRHFAEGDSKGPLRAERLVMKGRAVVRCAGREEEKIKMSRSVHLA